jgi:hypothetical protein
VNPPSCNSLPSSDAAADLVDGKPSGLWGVVTTGLGRAALISVGLYLAGEREHVVRNALAGALAIETFVLGYVAYKKHRETRLP